MWGLEKGRRGNDLSGTILRQFTTGLSSSMRCDDPSICEKLNMPAAAGSSYQPKQMLIEHERVRTDTSTNKCLPRRPFIGGGTDCGVPVHELTRIFVVIDTSRTRGQQISDADVMPRIAFCLGMKHGA